MLDRRALYATSFVRAVTTSLVGVLLGIYLARLNVTSAGFGVVVSSGLAGAALAAIFATLAGDRLGRRRVLLALTLLSMIGTIAFALRSTPLALAAAAFVGMVTEHRQGPWGRAHPRTGGTAQHDHRREAHGGHRSSRTSPRACCS